MLNSIRMIFGAGIWICLLVGRSFAADAHPVRYRVAVGTFSTDDGFQRSQNAISKTMILLQSKLQETKDVEWIERQQLEKIAEELNLKAMGMMRGSSALRLGRWVKADLLVLGRFHRVPEKGRVLTLEIVDLDHADVIAEESLPIEGYPRDPVPFRPSDVDAIAAVVQKMLGEAREFIQSNKKRVVIGPLFFRNTSLSPRLNFLEEKFLDAFVKVAAERGDVRVIRFPKAQDSIGEAELVMLGLAEADPEAWRKAADVYVWGNYEEIESKGLPFEEVPVAATLYVWNGQGHPTQILKRDMVKNSDELIHQLVESCFEKTLKKPAGEVLPTAREEVSHLLTERISEIEEKRRHPRTVEEEKALNQYLLKIVETACFFAPQNDRLQWEHFNLRWPSGVDGGILKANELGDYLQKFGTDENGHYKWSVAYQYIESLKAVFLGLLNGWVPVDAMPDEVTAWKTQAEKRCMREILQLHHRVCQIPNLGELSPMEKKAISNFYAYTPNCFGLSRLEKYRERVPHPEEWKQLDDILAAKSQSIKWTLYYDHPETAASHSNQVSAAKTMTENPLGEPSNSAPVSLSLSSIPVNNVLSNQVSNAKTGMHAPPKKVSPLKLANSIKSIPLLSPTSRFIPAPGGWVASMAKINHAIWISLKTPMLYRFDPVTDSFENLSARIGKHSPITSILEANGYIWLTLDSDGVWRLNPRTWEVAKFGTKDGVLTSHMYASAAIGDKIYFGGVEEGRRLVNVLDPASMKWSQIDQVAAQGSEQWRPVTVAKQEEEDLNLFSVNLTSKQEFPLSILHPLKYLRSFQGWLLMGMDPWVLFDSKINQGKDLLEMCGVQPVEIKYIAEDDLDIRKPVGSKEKFPILQQSGFFSCCADEKGYWLGTWEGLRFVDPKNGNSELLPCPSPFISALENDGEFLWVGCLDGKEWASYVLAFHKPSQKWVGYFKMTGFVGAICVSDPNIYITANGGTLGILEVDKRSILSTPKDHWISVSKSDS